MRTWRGSLFGGLASVGAAETQKRRFLGDSLVACAAGGAGARRTSGSCLTPTVTLAASAPGPGPARRRLPGRSHVLSERIESHTRAGTHSDSALGRVDSNHGHPPGSCARSCSEASPPFAVFGVLAPKACTFVELVKKKRASKSQRAPMAL